MREERKRVFGTTNLGTSKCGDTVVDSLGNVSALSFLSEEF